MRTFVSYFMLYFYYNIIYFIITNEMIVSDYTITRFFYVSSIFTLYWIECKVSSLEMYFFKRSFKSLGLSRLSALIEYLFIFLIALMIHLSNPTLFFFNF